MKRLGMVMLACIALAAGFAGSLVKDALVQPEPVHAQTTPIKIALLDLEKACRASWKFNELKISWDERRLRQEAETDQRINELNEKKRKLRNLLQSGIESDEPNFLRPEIAAMEEFLEQSRPRWRKYLGDLVSEYQKQVLEHVIGVAENYCNTQGYHLCLQDYQLDSGSEDELFKGAEFAARWLNKPVLFAPGVDENKNMYVKNITEDIVNRVKTK